MHRRARSAETMEKAPNPKLPPPEISSNKVVWDCGSSLYDSFELETFEKQLHSAITSRTLSMPHFIHQEDRRLRPPPPPQATALLDKKPMSKIMRSVRKIVRSVFKPARRGGKIDDSNRSEEFSEGFVTKEGFYVIYNKSGALSTIAEAPEVDGLSPEIKSLVRRTASDRFSSSFGPVGIYC